MSEAQVALAVSRARTEALTGAPDPYLTAQVDPLMSPLVWDLAHIGQQEELWLLRHLEGRDPLLPPAVEGLYDAFEHPRAERPSLPLLPPADARRYLRQVRSLVEDRLERGADDFAHRLVAQHEQQHVETMLATHQLRAGEPLVAASQPVPAGRPVEARPVSIPGGPCVIGSDEPWTLDNERPAHLVDVPAFRIGRFPVTNGQWQEFLGDGGYERWPLWTGEGWAHRQRAGLTAPLFWACDAGTWVRSRFGAVEPVPADEPVQHVSYWEADAFARWSGARLPTEVEWEKACAWDPDLGRRRRNPWGEAPWSAERANLAVVVGALRPAPVGAYPAGASAYGVEQLLGDVWEWTSSPLSPWPGFAPMCYSTYSAPFFGDAYRVLRGGSWAVGPDAVRPSFRNWDLPIRRQIFAGLRLAWDGG